MVARLRRWFVPPRPGSRPSETLRWLRRVTVAVVPFYLLTVAAEVASGDSSVWLWVAGAAFVFAPLSMTRAVHLVERRESEPDHPPPDELGRKRRRTAIGFAAFQTLVLTIVLYVTSGVVGAIFGLVVGAAGGYVGFRWSRKLYERSNDAPPGN